MSPFDNAVVHWTFAAILLKIAALEHDAGRRAAAWSSVAMAVCALMVVLLSGRGQP